jgi:hypothetical protein
MLFRTELLAELFCRQHEKYFKWDVDNINVTDLLKELNYGARKTRC